MSDVARFFWFLAYCLALAFICASLSVSPWPWLCVVAFVPGVFVGIRLIDRYFWERP